MSAEVSRKKNPQKMNWIIDAALFTGLLVACVLDLTGLALHEWLGLGVIVFAVYHLLVHWQWVDAVTRRFFGKTSGTARRYYVIDVGLAMGFVAILVTGLVISTWLNLTLDNYLLWRDAHIVASIATVALTVVKIGLHWKWITQVSKRSIFKTAAPVAARAEGRPVAGTTSRRDFLRLMGGVSALALVATRPGLETWLGSTMGPVDAASEPSPSTALAANSTPTVTSVSPPSSSATGAPVATTSTAAPRSATATTVATAAPSATRAAAAAPATPVAPLASTGACTVRCNKRCSYPGQCRKYVDANRNGRCDLGECV